MQVGRYPHVERVILMRYVVARGTPWTGIVLYGPFQSSQAADEWAQRQLAGSEWKIIYLFEPRDDIT
jgi:hypothetical protein